MSKKLLIPTSVLAMLFPIMSCVGATEELPTAEVVAANTIQSMKKVDTYQFEVNVTIEWTVDVHGSSSDENDTMVISSLGTVDNANRRLQAETEATLHTMTTDGRGGDDEASMETYVIGDNSYSLIIKDTREQEELTLTWEKESLPSDSWEDMSEIYSQVAILETGEANHVSTEEIEGTSYYVLEIIPNMDMLLETVIQNTPQQWMNLSGYLTVFATGSGEGMEEVHENVSVKQWVDKETLYITKQEVVIDREIILDDFWGKGETSITTYLTITTIIHNYNNQVNIELPAEAQN